MRKNFFIKDGPVVATVVGLSLFMFGLPLLVFLENGAVRVSAFSDQETIVYDLTTPSGTYNTEIIKSMGPMYEVGALSDFEIGIQYDENSDIILSDTAEASILSEDDALYSESDDSEDEYANLAIANVTDFVNVRTEASAVADIVGILYDNSVCHIEEYAYDESGETWLKITSGNVSGYTKASYFITGNEAAEFAEDYISTFATVNVETLNVRSEANTNSSRIGFLNSGETVTVLENDGTWLKVSYAGDMEGYIYASYTTLTDDFSYALTLEEQSQQKAKYTEQASRVQTTTTTESLTYINTSTPPAELYTSNAELRQAIVTYAYQYLGNRYVSGGGSLAGGTDCSGFTSFIYRDFGYSISRIPNGQYTSNGRFVDYASAQPGDIVCYSGNGSTCTHVGIYIGDGQIIHSANSRMGVVVSDINYCGAVLAIKNVID